MHFVIRISCLKCHKPLHREFVSVFEINKKKKKKHEAELWMSTFLHVEVITGGTIPGMWKAIVAHRRQ